MTTLDFIAIGVVVLLYSLTALGLPVGSYLGGKVPHNAYQNPEMVPPVVLGVGGILVGFVYSALAGQLGPSWMLFVAPVHACLILGVVAWLVIRLGETGDRP